MTKTPKVHYSIAAPLESGTGAEPKAVRKILLQEVC